MTNSIDQRLEELRITLPEASGPAAKYANAVLVNGLLYVSGKGPAGSIRGKLGEAFTTEQGYEFARQAGIEVLAVLKEVLGSLNKVKQVVKIQGFVNATSDFEEHHKVLNGYSDLLLDVFGDKGVHARSVLGAVSVRDNLPIIVDSIFQVEELPKFELKELTPQVNHDIYDMIHEIGSGENGFINSLYCENIETLQLTLERNHQMAAGIDLPEGYVPQTLYWLYVNDVPVGYGKLRHYLNANLLEQGGHIGYVIRPSERGKGYGKLILQELLNKAREKQIPEVLLTCETDNIVSRRIIESTRGRLSDITKGIYKYWISV